MRVAIQGEAGSFSHEAAQRMLPGCTIVACPRSAEVFDRVVRASVAAAVIPIENTLAGSVAEHFDLLLASQVFIQREFRLRIVHNLIAAPGVKQHRLRRVLSHPVALDQCRTFFRKHPGIEAVPFYDTAGSVKHVIENCMPDAAAIAGRPAAAVYKGHILAAGIEDDKHNFTRFFLLRKTRRVLQGANKTSIAFGLSNVQGALHEALGVFAERKISLSKIESRPMRGRPWEYVFYADFLRGDDAVARSALRHLAQVTGLVKVLGIYPAA
ncbi:MAG: prephenate dehydratase domain-containing protein [Terriglobales bacterium]|jgi:prephenate dehydratase